MMYPNGRHMSRSPYKHYGPGPGLDVSFRNRSDTMSRYVGETWNRTSSSPEGYGLAGLVPAIRSGAMSALVRMLDTDGIGNLLKGGPVSGSASWSMTGNNLLLSLTVGLGGTSTISISGNGLLLKLTIGLGGNGTWTLTGDSRNLALIVPFEGSGAWAFGPGSTDLRSRLSMSGAWTPFTELSPENLASSVWASVASNYNQPGTMGEKLNGAGSAGNPWTEVIESGLTAAEVMRIVLAVLAGKTTITGDTDMTFKSVDGVKDRATVHLTGSERDTVTLDGGL